MKSRSEAVKLIMSLLDDQKGKPGTACHFGVWDLRVLMDFIYESEPKSKEEEIER